MSRSEKKNGCTRVSTGIPETSYHLPHKPFLRFGACLIKCCSTPRSLFRHHVPIAVPENAMRSTRSTLKGCHWPMAFVQSQHGLLRSWTLIGGDLSHVLTPLTHNACPACNNEAYCIGHLPIQRTICGLNALAPEDCEHGARGTSHVEASGLTTESP